MLENPDRGRVGLLKDGSSTSHMLGLAAKGAALSLVGTLLGKGLFFVTRVLLIRMIGIQYFGYLAIGLMATEVSRILSSLGLSKGGMRFLSVALGADERGKLPAIMGVSLLVPLVASTVMAGFMFVYANAVAVHWFHNAELTLSFRLFAISIPLATMVRVAVDLSRGFKTTKYSVLTDNILLPTLKIGLFFGIYPFRPDYVAMIYSIILSEVIALAFILTCLGNQTRRVNGHAWNLERFIVKFFSFESGRDIIGYSFPLFLTGCTGVVLSSLDIFMLGGFVDASAVGVYAAAASFTTFLSATLLIASVNSIFAPLVASEFGRQDHDRVGYLYVATTRWMFYLALPLLALILVARNPLMALFGREVMDGGAMVLLILSIGQMANCLTGAVGNVLSMTGHQNKELTTNIVAVILNVVLNCVWIPVYGMIGAAAATAMSQVLVNALRVWIVYRIFKVQPLTSPLVKLFAVWLVVVGVACWGTAVMPSDALGVALAVLASGITVGAVLLLGLEEEDSDLVRRFVRRFKHRPPDRNGRETPT